jgi:hypothetical protein
MVKQIKGGEINTGLFKYSWQKEINKIKTNKKFIQGQIDSFMILLENLDQLDIGIYGDELREFLTVVPAQGHLSKLDKDYQDKFFIISEFYEKHFSIRARADAVKNWSDKSKNRRKNVFP